MRRIITLAALVVALVGLAAPASSASPAAVPHVVAGHLQAVEAPAGSIPCQGSTVHGSAGSNPTWETKWDIRNGDCVQWAAAKCGSRIGTIAKWYSGGKVYPEGKWSGVNCNRTRPALLQGNIDWQYKGASSYVYCELWPKNRCG
jgi:hypothetical protein